MQENNSTYRNWVFVAIIITIPLVGFNVMKMINAKVGKVPVLYKYQEVDNNLLMLNFTNQKSETLTLKEMMLDNNNLKLVDFFFATCPSICPEMSRNMQKVHQVYANENVNLYSFTVDPEVDSVEALMEYANLYSADHDKWNFLTGKKIELYRVARKFFYITVAEGDGGDEDFIHSPNIVLLDQKGNIRAFYDGTSDKEIEKLFSDIDKLI